VHFSDFVIKLMCINFQNYMYKDFNIWLSLLITSRGGRIFSVDDTILNMIYN